MHLHYIKEGKVSTEPNSPVEPVTTDHTASPPAPAAGQTSSGKDMGKNLIYQISLLLMQQMEPNGTILRTKIKFFQYIVKNLLNQSTA